MGKRYFIPSLRLTEAGFPGLIVDHVIYKFMDGPSAIKPGEWVLQMPSIQKILANPPVIREMTPTVELECILSYLEGLPIELAKIFDTQRAYFAVMNLSSWQNRISHCKHFLPKPDSEHAQKRYNSLTELISSVRDELSKYHGAILTTTEQDEKIRKWRNLVAMRGATAIVQHITASPPEDPTPEEILDQTLPKLLVEYGLILMPFLADPEYMDFLHRNDPQMAMTLDFHPLIQKHIAAYKAAGLQSHFQGLMAKTRIMLSELRMDCRLLLQEIVEFESKK